MCVVMVIIIKKALEKKRVKDVTSKRPEIGQLRELTMSQGTTLFSRGLMEAGRWRELGQGCPAKPVGASLESLWDAVPEECQSPTGWLGGGGGGGGLLPGAGHPTSGSAITGLLRDLSLADASAAFSTAPPSKRQCRSLSCSDEPAGCRSAWRPQGSHVWTAVEKRRCHSGGSVHRGVGGGGAGPQATVFPAMQRSSSFSLPARSNAVLELPCFSQGLTPAFTGLASPSSSSSSSSSSSVTLSAAPALYLSHEQIAPRQAAPQGGASPPESSPDSTPELERRGLAGGPGSGGLARSRSQPCALNDKKMGVKRRRPGDTQRPSLDLAKMTQKLRNFHSLSCPGMTGEEDCPSPRAPSAVRKASLRESDFLSLSQQATEEARTKEGEVRMSVGSDATVEELGWSSPDYGDAPTGSTNGKDREHLWAGLCSPRKDMYQLGGMLDIEQIERN